jgi:K+-transporting ATPase ATPase B chain
MSTVTEASVSPQGERSAPTRERPARRASSAINLAQLVAALPTAVRKLDPRLMWRNPVMFIVEAGAALTTLLAIVEPFVGGPARSGGGDVPASFTVGIAFWLWLTVVFANLAEAVAEGRGKAQADSLRQTRASTNANLVVGYDEAADAAAERASVSAVSSADLTLGDTVIVVAGELVPGDGDIIWGIASIDESAITGESAPVVRESGGDRSAVTGGTRVLSDRIVVRITSKPGETFVDRMIALVEGASRQKTPNELALNILLASLSIVFLVVTLTLNPIAGYSAAAVSLPVLVALLVCLIPTTIGALLSAIGIAGMDRLVQRNVLAMSGRAVEAAGDVTILLLDKTGTITYGNRQAREFTPLAGVDRDELINAAALSSLSDPTPEGKSIVDLAIETGFGNPGTLDAVVVPFTAQTRMSGIDLPDGSYVRKGAGSAVLAWVRPGRDRATDLRARWHPARRGRGHRGGHRGGRRTRRAADPGRGVPQGHRQGGHRRTIRRAAHHGHPHDHGDRRQPPDRQDDRSGGRRRRLPRRGDPRGQARTHQARAGGRQPRRHDG